MPEEPKLPKPVLASPLYQDIRQCQRCVLRETRTQVVYGRGDPRSPLWFVGEAPGSNEDKQGLAFVGRAGNLLDLCLAKKNVEQVFITNVVKCRPPGNRNPTAEELACCNAWLRQQIWQYSPAVIVAMGRYSIGHFLGFSNRETEKMTVGKQVGRVTAFGENKNIAIMPTYHPAYLLRNPEATKKFLVYIDRANKLCQKLTKRP